MNKQYIIQKFVMANSVTEAIKKSKSLPIHEVYVHSPWFEKAANFQWTIPVSPDTSGFKQSTGKKKSGRKG